MHRTRAGAASTFGLCVCLLALALSLLFPLGAAADPTAYVDAILVDGPRGYWRLGELDGAVAADSSGLGSPGSYLGGATLGVPGAVTGDADAAVHLDGGNDLVGMGDPASGALDFGTGDFSVELWVRTALNGERTLAAKRGSGGGSWLLTVTDDSGHAGQIRAGISDGVTGKQVYSTRAIDDGQWHHVVVVVDRHAALRFYVDGLAAGSAAGPPTGSVSNTGPFQLGKVSGYAYLNGDLDEVAVYDSALTEERIAAHFQAAEPKLPPTLTVVSGPPDPTSSTDATFAFFPSEAASLECALDAEAFAPCVSPHGFAGLAEGTHVFRVRGTDLAGSTGPPTSYSWRVDTTPPPVPAITTAPPDPSNDPDSTISFTGEAGATFLCRLDGTEFAACSSPYPYAGLADGPHLFEVKARDAAGNEGPTTGAAWLLDTVDPAPPVLTGAPPDPTDTGDATFSFTLVEGIGFLCRLDGSAFAPCTSPQTYLGLPDDRHVFDVRSVDEAGNGSEPVRFTWTIERGPPAPTVDSGPASLTTATSASLSFSDSAAGTTFECRLDGGAFSPCASPQPYADLADGPHTFEVKAFSPEGYDSPEAGYSWSVDTTAPSPPTLTERPPDLTASAAATFGFSDGSGPPTPAGGALPAPLPEPAGTTYYVSTSGSDAGPGTLEQPWRTVQKALDTLGPGERAFVRGGVYPQNLHLDEAGTLAAPITVESFPGEQAVLRPNPASPSFPIRISSSGAYFRLRGFMIEEATGATTANVYISNSSHDIEISQNEIRGSDSHGILLDGDTARVHLLGNRIHSNGSLVGSAQDHGIYFQGTDHVAAGNVIYDHPFGFGIQVFDENHGSIVAHNTIVASGKSGIVLGGAVGVDGVRVIGNILAFNSRWGLSYDSAPPTASRADHNLTFGNHDGGIQPDGTGIDLSGGNVEADPRFVSLSQRDLRLHDDSPAVGAALADFASARDLNGRSRESGGLPDIGAFETGVGFECSLDGGPYAQCASPRELAGLADGTHTFEVRALDDAGNAGAANEVSWSVDTSPPATSIVGHPLDPSSESAPSFDFVATEADVSFACWLDGGSFAPCSSPQVVAGLADGAHSFEVRASDRAGNTGAAATYSWTLDTTAPPTPAIDAAPPVLTASRSAELVFSSTEGAVSFRCRLDADAFGQCSSPTLYTGLGDGTHVFEATARDAAGNESAAVAYAWIVDTTPPPVPELTSRPESPTRATGATLAFSSDEPGVLHSCRLDGAPFAPCVSPQLYADLGEGAHTFEVVAEDAAGNASAAAAATWIVDTTAPPTPAIDAAPPALTASRSAELAFSSAESGVSFRCRLDDALSADCTSPTMYASLSDGVHAFEVTARDEAGNESGAAARTWTVDGTAPPAPAIVSAPPSVSASPSASFGFTDGEAGVLFACRLDLAPFAECSSPILYEALAEGGHTFWVKAHDAAGNESPAQSYTWTVTTSPPDASPLYHEVVLADQPRGYWRLGELLGAAAADASGLGSTGSFAGGVVLGVAGALVGDTDAAARFDGVNDLVTTGDPASGALDFGADDFSLELWLRTAVNGERTLVAKRSSGAGWLLTVTDDPGKTGRLRATLNDGAVTQQVYSTIRVDDDAWHHVVVVFDRDAGTSFFVDGAPAGFTGGVATGSVSNAAAFQLAKTSGYPYFRGDLDEVAVYGEALGAARIQAHFDAGRRAG